MHQTLSFAGYECKERWVSSLILSNYSASIFNGLAMCSAGLKAQNFQFTGFIAEALETGEDNWFLNKQEINSVIIIIFCQDILRDKEQQYDCEYIFHYSNFIYSLIYHPFYTTSLLWFFFILMLYKWN